MAYVMGGDPDLERSGQIVESVIRGGADVLEIGIPFSDPIADGKSIQAASVRSLSSGTRPADVLGLASQVKKSYDVPVALMTYYNIIYSNGPARFLDSAKESGVDGIIVPDLPLEEAGHFSHAASRRGIDSILLAAPTTGEERLRKIAETTRGFLYLVSVLGVTGAREELKSETIKMIRRASVVSKVPVAVGFGISSPSQVADIIGAGADAAVVGSAIVEKASAVVRNKEKFSEVEKFVRSLKGAARTTRTSSRQPSTPVRALS